MCVTHRQTFRAQCGRGPLLKNWQHDVAPVMCAYKKVTCEIQVWGMAAKVENFMQGYELDLFHKASRNTVCWMDEWHGLTMEELRLFEADVQRRINLITLIKQGLEEGIKLAHLPPLRAADYKERVSTVDSVHGSWTRERINTWSGATRADTGQTSPSCRTSSPPRTREAHAAPTPSVAARGERQQLVERPVAAMPIAAAAPGPRGAGSQGTLLLEGKGQGVGGVAGEADEESDVEHAAGVPFATYERDGQGLPVWPRSSASKSDRKGEREWKEKARPQTHGLSPSMGPCEISRGEESANQRVRVVESEDWKEPEKVLSPYGPPCGTKELSPYGPPSSPAKMRPHEPQGGDRDAQSSDDGNGKVGGETESLRGQRTGEANSARASDGHRHPTIAQLAQHCGGALTEKEVGTHAGNRTGNGTETALGPSWVRRGSESKSAHAVASGNGNGRLASCAASCATSCGGAGMAVRWRTNQRSPRGLERVCCMSGCGKVRMEDRVFRVVVPSKQAPASRGRAAHCRACLSPLSPAFWRSGLDTPLPAPN
jgi:hypothetical protein